MQFPKIYNVYFLASIATIGGMLFGFDISSLSAIVISEQYVAYFNNPAGVVQGGIGSALAGGSVVGAIMAGPVSDRWGRRDSIFFACLWWLLGTILQVAVNGIPMLIVGRFINGICVGITSSQVPVYLAEIAKKDKRGSIIVIQQWAIGKPCDPVLLQSILADRLIEWGIFIMFFVGYGCNYIGDGSGTASFRTAWSIQFVPAVLLMMGIPFLPRSPRWLAKVGRDTEAIETLARIQAGGNIEDPLVVAEWEEIQQVLQAENESGRGWRKFFKNGMWKRTAAGMSVQAWQQLSGANVMTYYVTYIFLMAGFKGNLNLVASGIQYAIFIVGTAATFFFIDHTGRRPLLIYGALAMGICMFIVGGVIGTYGTYVPGGIESNGQKIASATYSVSGSPAYTVIAFCYILVLAYSMTLAPIAWVYAAEVWSLGTRAYGMALASIANWLFNFAIGFFIPPGFENIGWKLFIIFGTLCFGAAIQAFLTYPETCGKSLEEIELLFSHGAPPAWKTKPGDSLLDQRIAEVMAGNVKHGDSVATGVHIEHPSEKVEMTA